MMRLQLTADSQAGELDDPGLEKQSLLAEAALSQPKNKLTDDFEALNASLAPTKPAVLQSETSDFQDRRDPSTPTNPALLQSKDSEFQGPDDASVLTKDSSLRSKAKLTENLQAGKLNDTGLQKSPSPARAAHPQPKAKSISDMQAPKVPSVLTKATRLRSDVKLTGNSQADELSDIGIQKSSPKNPKKSSSLAKTVSSKYKAKSTSDFQASELNYPGLQKSSQKLHPKTSSISAQGPEQTQFQSHQKEAFLIQTSEPTFIKQRHRKYNSGLATSDEAAPIQSRANFTGNLNEPKLQDLPQRNPKSPLRRPQPEIRESGQINSTKSPSLFRRYVIGSLVWMLNMHRLITLIAVVLLPIGLLTIYSVIFWTYESSSGIIATTATVFCVLPGFSHFGTCPILPQSSPHRISPFFQLGLHSDSKLLEIQKIGVSNIELPYYLQISEQHVAKMIIQLIVVDPPSR